MGKICCLPSWEAEALRLGSPLGLSEEGSFGILVVELEHHEVFGFIL